MNQSDAFKFKYENFSTKTHSNLDCQPFFFFHMLLGYNEYNYEVDR
jgi:hypothetical protein